MFNQNNMTISSNEGEDQSVEDLTEFGKRFPVGRVLNERRANACSFSAMMVDYDRDFPVSGNWYSGDVHFFDMSLSKRPPGARGYFGESFRDYRSLGKIFFLPAGHRYHGEGGQGRQQSLSLFLRSRPIYDDELDFGSILTPVLSHCLHLESVRVQDLLIRIAKELTQPGFASEMLLEGLSLTLLVETARLLHALNDKGSRKGGLSPLRLKVIEERIRGGDRSTSIAELAELSGLSRRQLIRAFRAETGQTIGSYVQRLTLERAKILLSETDKPIGGIAAELGFGTAASFATAFYRATGQYPRHFRGERRLEDEAVRSLMFPENSCRQH